MHIASTSDIFCLDASYSTTRLLTWKTPNVETPPDAKFESVLFLAENRGRKGYGGLRTKGYFKKSMPDRPLITVITVVFNGEKHLEDTILSVLDQAYDNVEYIIVDGGSTDGTVDIIKKYEGQIDFWVSEKDEGIYDAMNKGWMLASESTSILFLGAGDRIILLPKKIEQDRIIHGTVQIGAGNYYTSKGDWTLQYGNSFHHQALLIPKQFAPYAPFNIAYSLYADFDFNQRLCKQGHKFERDDQFASFALPGGVSSKLDILQTTTIVYRNHGKLSALISFVYGIYQRLKQKI